MSWPRPGPRGGRLCNGASDRDTRGSWTLENHRACRQLQVVREARTKCLPDRCRDGILAAWWAVEVRIKRGQVGPQVEVDAGRPHQEPDGALEELMGALITCMKMINRAKPSMAEGRHKAARRSSTYSQALCGMRLSIW